MTKKICISGYYGFDNFGDETILKILVENLKKLNNDIQITVFSSNPQKTSEKLDVSSIKSFDIPKILKAIRETDCLISGGGSLLQDATSKKSLLYYLFVIYAAVFFKKKIIIFAQGIGPIKNNFLNKLTAYAIKKASYITVRDENSHLLLKKWGINSILCNDPVWNINIYNNEKTDKIGIQLRKCPQINELFLIKLAESVINQYKDKEICIFSLQNSLDLDICNDFKKKLLNIYPNANVKVMENNSNEKVQEDIASCKELIAMRYHACLIGIKAGIKVLPINYDIKVEQLANEFGLKYINLYDFDKIQNTIEKFSTQALIIDEEKTKSKLFNFDEMMNNI